MGKSKEEEIEVTGTTVFDGSHLDFGVGAFCDGICIMTHEVVEHVVPVALHGVGKRCQWRLGCGSDIFDPLAQRCSLTSLESNGCPLYQSLKVTVCW